MPKEYFSHDYNARNDPRCKALIKDFGMAGYGVYWCLVEIMNEEGGRIKKFPSLLSGLAEDLKVRELTLSKQIEAMLHKYQLLTEDDKFIWSESVLKRLSEREAKKTKRQEAGRLGGISSGKSRQSKTDAKQNEALVEANEANEAKESKVKESKGNSNTEIAKAISPARKRIQNFTGEDKDLKKEFEALEIPTDRKQAWTTIKNWIVEKNPQFIEPYATAWNVYASYYNFPSIQRLNETRRRKFQLRIKEESFSFFDILDKAKRSDFLKEGKWFGFDWIIENDRNYLKILEENYK